MLNWWSHSVFAHTIGGLMVSGLAVFLVGVVVLAVLAGVLHGVAGARDAFAGGFRKGWDRPGDPPRE